VDLYHKTERQHGASTDPLWSEGPSPRDRVFGNDNCLEWVSGQYTLRENIVSDAWPIDTFALLVVAVKR
jgi:hypothetical protein